ncbi:polynucleotide adenylyltransferase PcnB [bacterium]|nr:polynucleotide adenylyltransferase PcnB [candidate division CSSED10-310 bacterium]
MLVYERHQHPISRKKIAPSALKVLYRLHHMGYKAYLVGGSVRDLMLGKEPKDFDVATDARPEQIRRIFRNCFLIGRRFRLAHIKFGHEIIEVSTFRRTTDSVDENGEVQMVLQDNLFGSPEEDAQRRDFTINGLFYDIGTFRVIDYVGGLEDLRRRSVRAIGDPNVRFQEDPVRMVRAARVAGRLGFDIEAGTLEAVRTHRAKIQDCPIARIREEFLTLIRYGAAERSLKMLHHLGLSEYLFPELDIFLTILREQDLAPEKHFWAFMEALDRSKTDDYLLTPAVLAGALLLPMIRHQLQKPEESHPNRMKNLPDHLERFVKPFVDRLQLPKRHHSRMVNIFTAQRKYWLIGQPKFRPGPFTKKPYFAEGLVLFTISSTALEQGADLVEKWHHRSFQDSPQDTPGSPPPRRRRRRRPKPRARDHID